MCAICIFFGKKCTGVFIRSFDLVITLVTKWKVVVKDYLHSKSSYNSSILFYFLNRVINQSFFLHLTTLYVQPSTHWNMVSKKIYFECILTDSILKQWLNVYILSLLSPPLLFQHTLYNLVLYSIWLEEFRIWKFFIWSCNL